MSGDSPPPGGVPPGEVPLDRVSLNQALLEGGEAGPAAVWQEIKVVPATGSTNADLLAMARSGAGEGLVLVAEAQTAGRGRLGRSWVSAPGVSLTFSVLLRPRGVPSGLLGWVPLLAGVAVVSALRTAAAVDARLKWPNDVLAGEGKLAGILAEGQDGAVVAGIGINVRQRAGELPVPGATSLYLQGADLAPGIRERVLAAVLTDLAHGYRRWHGQASPGDAVACGLHAQYRRCCDTLGRPVRVLLPGGQAVTGTAAGIDATGRLEVRTPAGLARLSAGEVVHLR